MELTKLSASYNLKDLLDNWITEGRVNVELDGTIHIDINTNLTSALLEGSQPNWGSAKYTKQQDSNVNVYFNFSKNYKTEFVTYCEQLFKQVLENLESTNNQ